MVQELDEDDERIVARSPKDTVGCASENSPVYGVSTVYEEMLHGYEKGVA
jgi:hypothetical protein